MSKLPGWNSTRFANWLTAIVLVLVPFDGFLTVWGSSLVGHYTVLRLWDEVLLAVLVLTVVTWLARERKLRQELFGNLLFQLMLCYVGLNLLLGLISFAKGEVVAKALGYGLVSDLRYFAWFIVVWLVAKHSAWLRIHWLKLLLVPAALVVVFAGLQFSVLPHNFLSHFGYNSHTIAPIETINHNSRYIRVQSSLRGANPLGAYLVIMLSALAALFIGRRKGRWGIGVFGLLALFALYATGSRSAWIGALLAVVVAGLLIFQTKRSRIIFGASAAAVVVVLAAGFLVLRSNVTIENTLLHTQKHSAVATGSDSAHFSALRKGLKDVGRQPFGDGPGTAGPASVYNAPHTSRIAENYFVQVAQESGWLGLGLFLAISIVIGLELYRRASGSVLALLLFASFIGLNFVNLLSHAWADDTLAYVWWGLAAIALAQPLRSEHEVQH